MNHRSGNIRIAKNTLYLYIRLFVVMIVSLFSIRVILNQLGINDFGIFNVVAGFITTIGFVGSVLTSGIQRFYNYEMGQRGVLAAIEVFSSAVKILIWCSGAILILFETIGVWYLNTIMVLPSQSLTSANWLYQFSVLSLISNIAVIPYNSFVISREHMDFYAVVSTLESFGKLFIALSLGFFPEIKLEMYGFLLFLISLINFLCYFIFCRIKYGWLIYKRIHNSIFVKKILSFSGWNSLNAFTNIGRTQGINLLLNYFFGVAINAANAITVQIYSTVQLFSLNICTAFKPQLVASYANSEFARVKNLFYIMSKVEYAMVFTICIPLILHLDFILKIWLGSSIPDYTSKLTLVALIIILFGSLHTPITQIFYAEGNLKWFNIIYSLHCLCIPLGWIAFRYNLPANSIYIISLIITIIILSLSLGLMKKFFRYDIMDYTKKVLLPICIFSILTSIPPIIFNVICECNNWIKLSSTCLICFISASISFYYFILNSSQRKTIKTRVQVFISKI